MALPVEFPLEKCFKAPKVHPAPSHSAPGVQSLFFENEDYLGKPTRVFAWMGLPHLEEGKTCPAMVLIHGGGGTALEKWVRLWNARGYAAIAIDTCGGVPPEDNDAPMYSECWTRHDHSGPVGWHSSIEQVEEAIENQWCYHALTALLRAHSLLASQAGVDSHRIGVTGVSWGGVLTSLIMGIDPRYALAVPVYGCGFLLENTSLIQNHDFDQNWPDKTRRWCELWDPKHYIGNARCPSLWINGTNDFAFPLTAHQSSAMLSDKNPKLTIIEDMPHNQQAGMSQMEVACFADAILKGETPLGTVTDHGCCGDHFYAIAIGPRPFVSAQLISTRATGMVQDRKYRCLDIPIVDGRAEAPLPRNTTIAYINFIDDRGAVISSPHLRLDQSDS